ncbi:MAG: helix-turn-helix transcriptional regulator [Weeksellaceae bacterium]|nr:helix-turn-helix transcriptional regulator [Weeksellaceae bacterium]
MIYLCVMLADRIKSIIRRKNTTSKAVAEQLGISTVYFSRMINGNPRVSSLQAVADALGCELGDFFVTSEPIIVKMGDGLHTFDSVDDLRAFLANQD